MHLIDGTCLLGLVSAEYFCEPSSDFGKILNDFRDDYHSYVIDKRIVQLLQAFTFYDQKIIPCRESGIVCGIVCGIYFADQVHGIQDYKLNTGETRFEYMVTKFDRTKEYIRRCGFKSSYDIMVKFIVRAICEAEFCHSLNISETLRIHEVDPYFAAKMAKLSDAERECLTDKMQQKRPEYETLRLDYKIHELCGQYPLI